MHFPVVTKGRPKTLGVRIEGWRVEMETGRRRDIREDILGIHRR